MWLLERVRGLLTSNTPRHLTFLDSPDIAFQANPGHIITTGFFATRYYRPAAPITSDSRFFQLESPTPAPPSTFLFVESDSTVYARFHQHHSRALISIAR